MCDSDLQCASTVDPIAVKLDLRFCTNRSGRDPDDIANHVKQILFNNCNCEVLMETLHHNKALHQSSFEDELYEVFVSVCHNESLVPLTAQRALQQRKEPVDSSINYFGSWCQDIVRGWCSGSAYGLHEQIHLNVVSPFDSYYRICKSEHKLLLSGLAIGNLFNFGVFRSAYDLRNQCSMPDINRIEDSFMKAHFHHDRRYLLLELCHCGESYEMTIFYKSIHHLVVDVGESDCGDLCVYLELKYPPMVKKKSSFQQRQQSQGRRNSGQQNREYVSWSRVTTFHDCSADCFANLCTLKLCFFDEGQQYEGLRLFNVLWQILSRIRARQKVEIWFAAVKFAQRKASSDILKQFRDCLRELPDERFPVCYALEAILSRGYKVLDQLSTAFLDRILFCMEQNMDACVHALNNIVNAIDERRNICLLRAYQHIYNAFILGDDDPGFRVDDEETLDPGMCKVRKIVFTPTRMLFLAPEIMLHNRITRHFKPEYALRVSFRDDSMCKMFARPGPEEKLFEKMVSVHLKYGVTIGQRLYQFLGWSNSQLRDHGCYMYCKTDTGQTVGDIRRWMGDFSKIKNVPKLMARMGQCFTQSLDTLDMSENSHIFIRQADFKGPMDPGSGEPFCFSDGVGRIAKSIADKITHQLQNSGKKDDQRRFAPKATPSAFQIRYAGYKGMLTVDPRLDLDNCELKAKIIFRDSMYKFEAEKTSRTLEVVKWSQPTRLTLNRPLIMILDQMCKKEKEEMRLRKRVHHLLEVQLFEMADMLMSERKSAAALNDRTSLSIDFMKLADCQFRFTSEPFFRSMLLAIHDHSSLYKCKVEIPWDKGRVMYGVLDETGVLNYGQVYVRYSIDPRDLSKGSKVHTGRVMITKNPCIVPGDVRMLKAVDASALSHLVDVIVFPRVGPRPHTDEMAGSDLDGDEYSVFWDPELYLTKNYSPMIFQKSKPVDSDELTIDHMIDFFRKYVSCDNIGIIATAHLCAADRLGLEHAVCQSIAEKHSMAVDFPKTGKPPEPLVRDEETKKFPDFLNKEYKLTYRSEWLLGQLSRKIKKVSDIIQLGQGSAPQSIDEHIVEDGWEEQVDDAIKLRDQYNGFIQSMLDQYGVLNEGQLVSGHMTYIRNRLCEKEKDDFSFFNTERIIELRIQKLWRKFRTKFFEEWGPLEVFEFVDQLPYQDMIKKAVAWYRVTYDPQYGNSRRFLSFPWIVWDVLHCIKRDKVYGKDSVFSSVLNPIQERLLHEISAIPNSPRFVNAWLEVEKAKERFSLLQTLAESCPFLDAVLVVLVKWLQEEGLIGAGRKNIVLPVHICALFYNYVTEKSEKTLDFKLPVTAETFTEQLLLFVKFMGSNDFREIKDMSLYNCKINEKQFQHLHHAAFKTYHHVALTGRFESLHLSERPATQPWDYDELDPVELPAESIPDQMIFNGRAARLLKEWSGCTQVEVRKTRTRGFKSIFVTASGKIEARQLLRVILMRDEKELYRTIGTAICPDDLDVF